MEENRLETMPRSAFKDISQMVLAAGDLLILIDDAGGTRYSVEIDEVLPKLLDDPTKARYRVTVVESTNPKIKPGQKLQNFDIDMSKVIWGRVLRKGDMQARMSVVEIEEFCLLEVRKFLDRQENYRARFKTVVQFLVAAQFLPEKDGTTPKTANYKFVQALCHRYKQYVKSDGGWINSTGRHLSMVEHELGEKGTGVIDIDFRRLTLGIRMVLESISIIRLKNAE